MTSPRLKAESNRRSRIAPLHAAVRVATLSMMFATTTVCGPREPVLPADLFIAVRNGEVTAPDTIGAGWLRVRVTEDGGGHVLVVFRIPDSSSAHNPSAFLAALDTGRATPAPAVALGGPEVGTIGDVIIGFTPGYYLLSCVRRGDDGHRHASSGETTLLVVTRDLARAGRDTPPSATQEVVTTEFAYAGPDKWAKGAHLIRIDNRGQQDHQVRLARLNLGATIRSWLEADDPNDHATTFAGVARLSSGAVAYLPVELEPGEYVLYCLVTDPASGKAHAELGMLRAIHVE